MIQDVLPFVIIMKEINFVLKLQGGTPTVLYSIFENLATVYEDNQGVIALTVSLKMRSRTKHTAVESHHFRGFIANGDVEIKHFDTKEHIVDIFMRPLDSGLLGYLNYKLNGW